MDLYAKQLTKALKQKNDIGYYIDEILKNQDFVSMIKKRWLKGLNPNGDKIGLYASDKYSKIKFKQNKKAGLGNVDLIKSGEMVNNIMLQEQSDMTYFFGSGVNYFEKIADDFGLVNFNITPEQKQNLINNIYSEIITKYTQEVWQNV
jgi:hypothetical protein